MFSETLWWQVGFCSHLSLDLQPELIFVSALAVQIIIDLVFIVWARFWKRAWKRSLYFHTFVHFSVHSVQFSNPSERDATWSPHQSSRECVCMVTQSSWCDDHSVNDWIILKCLNNCHTGELSVLGSVMAFYQHKGKMVEHTRIMGNLGSKKSSRLNQGFSVPDCELKMAEHHSHLLSFNIRASNDLVTSVLFLSTIGRLFFSSQI